MSIRKTICMLLTTVLLFCSACSAFSEAAEPDYYSAGLEVTALMGEIADSEAYLSMLVASGTFSEIREKVNTHDYDRPAAVYSVRMSDPKALLETFFRQEPETRETWDSLSPALQDLLLARLSLSALCTQVNARSGAEYLGFFSIANAFVRDERLTSEEPCYYLYFFEKGFPILVSFGYHSASGQFLAIPEEYRSRPEDISTFLGLPGLELSPVKTAASAAAQSGEENLAAHGISLEDAVSGLNRSIAEQFHSVAQARNPEAPPRRYELSDVTGDGCVDLCTNITWGSGMVRTDLFVYDPLNQAAYILDGYSYDYLIDSAEPDRLVVVKEGPHGYGDPVTKTYGTVRLENRELVFVPDSETP